MTLTIRLVAHAVAMTWWYGPRADISLSVTAGYFPNDTIYVGKVYDHTLPS